MGKKHRDGAHPRSWGFLVTYSRSFSTASQIHQVKRLRMIENLRRPELRQNTQRLFVPFNPAGWGTQIRRGLYCGRSVSENSIRTPEPFTTLNNSRKFVAVWRFSNNGDRLVNRWKHSNKMEESSDEEEDIVVFAVTSFEDQREWDCMSANTKKVLYKICNMVTLKLRHAASYTPSCTTKVLNLT